ncbi:CHC2 zinc finger domain-containing protein, partial [Klebsiella pneumoniae]
LGLCPFHPEKTPSFVLYDDHFYCFGCKKSGDAIDFVRATEGLGFVDAMRFLASKLAIEIPELEAAQGRRG